VNEPYWIERWAVSWVALFAALLSVVTFELVVVSWDIDFWVWIQRRANKRRKP